MDSTSDTRLEDLLGVAIDRVSELDTAEYAYLDEIFPAIGGEVHSQNAADTYEKILVEQSIARIHNKIHKKHEALSEFFDSIPEFWVGEIWTLDLFQEPHYLSEEEWEFAKGLCHSNLLMDDAILLSNICSEVVKIRTAELISREILSDQYGGEKGVNWILENGPIPSQHRPVLLKKSGIISSDLECQIQTITETRNEMIHDLGRRYQQPAPDDLMSHIEDCLSAIEALDDQLGYPSMVRMYREYSHMEYMGQLFGDIYEVVENEDINSTEEVFDIVGDKYLEHAIVNEDSPMRDQIVEIMQDDEKFTGFLNNLLNKLQAETESEKEYKIQIMAQAEVFKENLDINLLRKIKDNRETFESRIPDRLFHEEIISEFDPQSDGQ